MSRSIPRIHRRLNMQDPRQTLLGSKLYKGASASASIYLTWSCAELLSDGRLQQISPTVFRCGDTIIAVRHLSGLGKIPEHGRMIYVIDDDWRSGLTDASLPNAYRLQLLHEFLRTAPKLERCASTILTASERLTDLYSARYPDKDILEISPAWPQASNTLPSDAPTSIAYLSAVTHRADAKFLIPVIDAVLEKHPEIQLTVSHAFDVPAAWKGKRQVNKLPSMSWSAYQAWVQEHRFDVLLYPLLDTPFNASRSANKLHESDQLGAALIASDTWQPGRSAAEIGRCVVKKNTQSQWIDGILDILETPGGANLLALRNRSVFTEDPPLNSQKLLWDTLLSR